MTNVTQEMADKAADQNESLTVKRKVEVALVTSFGLTKG